jgi:hypothetical protein
MKGEKIVLKRNITFLLVAALLLISAIAALNISYAAGDVKVQMNNSNTAATTNSISPKIKLINQSSSAINLSTVTIRYYYTVDGDKTQSYWCDYAAITSPSHTPITSNVTGKFVKMSTAVTGADYYLEIGFTSAAGSLAAGGTVEIQSRFAKTDWTNYTQTNDYSFNPTATNYADTTKVTAYTSGTLQWGTEPDGSTQPTATPTVITITPTPTVTTVTPTPITVTPVRTATPVITTPTPTPTPTQVTIPPVTPTPGNIVIPPYSSLQANAKLPDPFKFMDGTRMTRKDQWAQRRAEISALSQAYEFGTKPPVPANVTGSYSSNRITVNVTENGKSISFSCSITYPSTGQAPYPAIIGVGGSNLNNSVIASLGVAVISFPNNEIAEQTNASSRGKGKFYTIYGSGHSAGALIAWAWGVDCLITALEKTPAANINPAKLGVTGCSRNGKGALVCGAFCERIVLTIPQESGSGGAASWRVSDAQMASGTSVQTLSEIVGENCWFTSSFSQFSSTATKLPYDHHSIEGLCAPRALLVIENTSMVWLGNLSCWTNGNAAHMIWEGLGIPDKMGFSQVGHSDHCGFPSSQQPEVTAYIQKFLVGNGSGNTTIMKTDGGLNFDKAKWVDWTIPALQ